MPRSGRGLDASIKADHDLPKKFGACCDIGTVIGTPVAASATLVTPLKSDRRQIKQPCTVGSKPVQETQAVVSYY
jgi:hypothetical protein